LSDVIDRLVPIGNAAESLGVSTNTLRWWVQIGKIGSNKPGRQRLIPVSEINRIILESRVPARPEYLKKEAQEQVQSLATAA
jgi:excisionase family DNA binding protein